MGDFEKFHCKKPAVHIAVFRCGTCSGPMISRVIVETDFPGGGYSDTDLREHDFPAFCPVCGRSETSPGKAAAERFPIQWEHEIKYDPPPPVDGPHR
jgi:hypothetical protein